MRNYAVLTLEIPVKEVVTDEKAQDRAFKIKKAGKDSVVAVTPFTFQEFKKEFRKRGYKLNKQGGLLGGGDWLRILMTAD